MRRLGFLRNIRNRESAQELVTLPSEGRGRTFELYRVRQSPQNDY